MKISGTFEVKLQALESYALGQDGVQFGRRSIDKIFHGELDAASLGEMLSAATPVPSSAGYVALEQVRGKLNGKSGSFVLMHLGLMQKDSRSLQLDVLPDSATGELHGLTGKMQIRIEGGQHFYDFDYQLPAA
jgi:hypothetical protein